MAKKNSIAAGGLYARLTEQSETVLIDLLSQEHFAVPGPYKSPGPYPCADSRRRRKGMADRMQLCGLI